MEWGNRRDCPVIGVDCTAEAGNSQEIHEPKSLFLTVISLPTGKIGCGHAHAWEGFTWPLRDGTLHKAVRRGIMVILMPLGSGPSDRKGSKLRQAARRSLALSAIFAILLMLAWPSTAHGEQAGVTGLRLTSETAGTVVVSWGPPGPDAHRLPGQLGEVHRGLPFLQRQCRQRLPKTNKETIPTLEEGVAYKVRVRARYRGDELAEGQTKAWSTPWSAVKTITVAAQPRKEDTPDKKGSEIVERADGDPPVNLSTPTGLTIVARGTGELTDSPDVWGRSGLERCDGR